MENQQKIKSLMDRYEYSVPKVSIDGESHGELLLVAIGTGAVFAVIILIVLTSLVRYKKKSEDEVLKDRYNGNFTLAQSPSNSSVSSSSTQKSNLMFKYFGKSLSSFDVEKSSSIDLRSSPSGSIAINFDHNKRHEFYRQNILNVSDLAVIENDTRPKYTQTIAC